MKKAKLKQYGLATYLVVSLFVSAVSAGNCRHHPKPVETAAEACHQHSEEKTTEISSEQRGSDTGEIAQSVTPDDKCCCIEPARKVVAKIENLKIEKVPLADVYAPRMAVTFATQKLAVKEKFIAPFYLTDSFYNLAPGRAPPVL